MAEPLLDYPFVEIHCAVEKHGAINRRKIFRTPDGKIIAKGKKRSITSLTPATSTRTRKRPANAAITKTSAKQLPP